MRVRQIRQWLLLGSISMGLVGAFAVGCGSTDNGTTTDAGTDGTADVAVDTATGQDTGTGDAAKDAGSSCVEDSSIAQLSPPDAAIGEGGASVGLCLGCIKSNCAAELNACAADCPCNNGIESVLGCVLQGGAILTCGAPILSLPGNSSNLGLALGQCLGTNCQAECTPAVDAGSKDGGGDAANDAPDAD
jgi:hypothetical protein